MNSTAADSHNLPSADSSCTENGPLYLQPNIAYESRKSSDPNESGFSF